MPSLKQLMIKIWEKMLGLWILDEWLEATFDSNILYLGIWLVTIIFIKLFWRTFFLHVWISRNTIVTSDSRCSGHKYHQKDDFNPGITDESVLIELDYPLISWTLNHHPRDEYRELLEITVIFWEKFLKEESNLWNQERCTVQDLWLVWFVAFRSFFLIILFNCSWIEWNQEATYFQS